MSQINNELVKLPKDTQLLRTSPIEKFAKVSNSMNKPYLGLFTVIEDNSNKKVLIVKESTYNTEDEFCIAVLAAQRKKAVRDDGLLWLVDYNAEKINNFCSTFHKVKCYYLPHYQDLRTLMRDREAKNTPFSEQELTFMLFHLTNGLAALHNAGFTHKNITPECIDTTNLQNRVAKLIHHQDDPLADVKNIAFNQIQKQKELYLAPEIFTRTSELIKSKTPLPFDERKLDAFSLGMTILQAGLGTSIQDCYDKRTFKFNEENLAKHLDTFIAKHQSNQLLTDALQKLLCLDSAERIDAIGLHDMFPRIQEIYSYYEIPAETNPDIYTASYQQNPDDARAAEMARKYFVSSRKIYEPPTQPIRYQATWQRPAGQANSASFSSIAGTQVQGGQAMKTGPTIFEAGAQQQHLVQSPKAIGGQGMYQGQSGSAQTSWGQQQSRIL